MFRLRKEFAFLSRYYYDVLYFNVWASISKWKNCRNFEFSVGWLHSLIECEIVPLFDISPNIKNLAGIWQVPFNVGFKTASILRQPSNIRNVEDSTLIYFSPRISSYSKMFWHIAHVMHIQNVLTLRTTNLAVWTIFFNYHKYSTDKTLQVSYVHDSPRFLQIKACNSYAVIMRWLSL